MNTEKVIEAARACLGTPFHHQGRAPQAGLDCIGLVVVALRAAGLTVRDRLDYGQRPDGVSLVKALQEHGFSEVRKTNGIPACAGMTRNGCAGMTRNGCAGMTRNECAGMTSARVIQAGDILLFRYDHQPQHVALATGAEDMIHAFAIAGRVVETGITDYWKRRLVGVYRDSGLGTRDSGLGSGD